MNLIKVLLRSGVDQKRSNKASRDIERCMSAFIKKQLQNKSPLRFWPPALLERQSYWLMVCRFVFVPLLLFSESRRHRWAETSSSTSSQSARWRFTSAGPIREPRIDGKHLALDVALFEYSAGLLTHWICSSATWNWKDLISSRANWKETNRPNTQQSERWTSRLKHTTAFGLALPVMILYVLIYMGLF